MAIPLLELLETRGRALESFDRLSQGEIAEVARRHRGQQIETYVGGRSAVCEHPPRGLLEVVWRKVVVGGGDEGLEEAPALARGAAQQAAIGIVERSPGRLGAQRPLEPPCRSER